jgi:NAD(P)-dependent dehydrogenase (short-subunit alcohol dehydrogenase family)
MTRIAVVTGAGSGVGAAAATALASDGWTVVLAGRRRTRLDEVADAHPELHLDPVPTDVTDEESVRNLFQVATARHGRIDLLFNNAGMGGPPVDLDEIPLEDWQAVVDVNLTGVFLCTREAFGIMRRQRPQGGRIINNGSISAHTPRPQSIAYTATKHAITTASPSRPLWTGAPTTLPAVRSISATPADMTTATAEGALQPDGGLRPGRVCGWRMSPAPSSTWRSLPLDSNVATSGDGDQDAVHGSWVDPEARVRFFWGGLMNFIKQFDELGRDDIDQAGGKGANLGELTRAGLPVPPGFVITTDAYRGYVAEHQLADKITTLAAPTDDPEGYESASAQIRALFGGEVSNSLRAEIAEAYAALGEDPPVAVRSSATAEDLPEASFAGQQDTYLNVRGLEDLLVAVRECWASLWTARAMAYRARQGIDPASVSLAVVVQQMVDAEAAGVMFTANPSNGRRDEAVISAAWGLGESVVSGSVNTDNIVVHKPDGTIVSSETADKAVMTVPAEQRTRERPVPAEQRQRPVLSESDAVELAAYGSRIEDHYGAPQDIEWARVDGQFFIVQARPITALPEVEAPRPTDWSVPEPTAMYVRASIVEQMPDPLSPLFADMIDGAVTRSLQSLFQEFLQEDVIRDSDVGLPTVNGYAYYRYSRSGMGRLMWKSPPAFRMLFSGGTQGRWRTYSHPRYRGGVSNWTGRNVPELSTDELLAGVQELVDAAAEYYTAAGRYPGSVRERDVLDPVLRHGSAKDDPPARVFVLGDSEPIRAESPLRPRDLDPQSSRAGRVAAHCSSGIPRAGGHLERR